MIKQILVELEVSIVSKANIQQVKSMLFTFLSGLRSSCMQWKSIIKGKAVPVKGHEGP
jgi:hypothetical protein